jgi:cell wall-associated NlpC family hydrolase
MPIDENTKSLIRTKLVAEATKLIGIPYEFGAQWNNHTMKPKALDCSEATRGICLIAGAMMNLAKEVFLPDGSQNQFYVTIPVTIEKALPGDFAFLGRNAHPEKIYHVGMLYDAQFIWEARAFDPKASFETGKVILRDRKKWEASPSFVGYGRLRALA